MNEINGFVKRKVVGYVRDNVTQPMAAMYAKPV